jgi:hypothetical protein
VVAHLNVVQQLPYQNKEQSKRARTAGSQPSVYSITGFEPAPVGASRTMLNQLSKEIILVIAITIQHYDMEIEHKFFTTNLSQTRVVLFWPPPKPDNASVIRR